MVQPDTHAKLVDLALQPVGDAKKVAPPVLSGSSTWPPSLADASNRTTSCPRSAQLRAASAGRPPPTMTIFCPGASDGESHAKLSLARGGRVLDAVAEVGAIGRADTVADAVFLAAFQLGDHIGSAMWPRVMPTRSTTCSRMAWRAVARSLIRVAKDGQPDLAPEAARLFKEGRERGGHAGI